MTIKFIPQKDRHLAVASGDVQCAATTVETYVSWAAAGVPLVQVVQLDKSYGADGLAARASINKIGDLKGKNVGVDAPGTASYFGLAWILMKNGMTLKDVNLVTLSPQAAATAFVAGQNDAAMTYEPYLSTVRDNPASGKIIATTLEYPMVMDTLGCSPKFVKENARLVQLMVNSYFEAVDMIKAQPDKSFEIMGSAVKQTGEQFKKSQAFLRWQDKASNQKFFAGELQAFMKDASQILLAAGVIKQVPDMAPLVDASFIK